MFVQTGQKGKKPELLEGTEQRVGQAHGPFGHHQRSTFFLRGKKGRFVGSRRTEQLKRLERLMEEGYRIRQNIGTSPFSRRPYDLLQKQQKRKPKSKATGRENSLADREAIDDTGGEKKLVMRGTNHVFLMKKEKQGTNKDAIGIKNAKRSGGLEAKGRNKRKKKKILRIHAFRPILLMQKSASLARGLKTEEQEDDQQVENCQTERKMEKRSDSSPFFAHSLRKKMPLGRRYKEE